MQRALSPAFAFTGWHCIVSWVRRHAVIATLRTPGRETRRGAASAGLHSGRSHRQHASERHDADDLADKGSVSCWRFMWQLEDVAYNEIFKGNWRQSGHDPDHVHVVLWHRGSQQHANVILCCRRGHLATGQLACSNRQQPTR